MRISIFCVETPNASVESTDISEEDIASIFRIEEYANQETSNNEAASDLFLDPTAGDEPRWYAYASEAS
jgi:hypothetical protein